MINLPLIHCQLSDLAAELEAGDIRHGDVRLSRILQTIEDGLRPLTPILGRNRQTVRQAPAGQCFSDLDRQQLRDAHQRLVPCIRRRSDRAALLPAIQDALRNWPVGGESLPPAVCIPENKDSLLEIRQ